MSRPVIVWFRRDLRLADHPALLAAVNGGRPLVCVFIWAPEEERPWEPGAASNWWLHHSLDRLARTLAKRGQRLVIRRGPSLDALRLLARETGAGAVYWNRLYEPAVLARDKKVKAALRGDGLEARSFNGHLLHEPWTVLTQQERPYQVFTPFYKACQVSGDPSTPDPRPGRLPPPIKVAGLALDQLKLLPALDWADGLRKAWQPGEEGALALLNDFAEGPVSQYAGDRDRPDRCGTSRLSPHLHFGEISPRQVWHGIRRSKQPATEPYLRQLIWREFAHHLLYHFPHTPEHPLRDAFARFPWREHPKFLRAWQRGRTGYPLVDAGMRELWATGWMHNRVRMVTASFLVKDLLLSWQEGARWFWDTLVDADLANNTLGWQWSAGCGADAAPYFRIFNPHLQSARFDPAGAYIQRWVPELAGLTGARLQSPEPLEARRRSYPLPIVDHGAARQAALAAYDSIRPT